jgi:purine-binding chemotaxis protein CheW
MESFLVLKILEKLYAIGISYVREIIPAPYITPVPKSKKNILGLINLKGEIIPVLNICEILNISPFNFTKLIIIDVGEKFAMPVEEIKEITSLDNKSDITKIDIEKIIKEAI